MDGARPRIEAALALPIVFPGTTGLGAGFFAVGFGALTTRTVLFVILLVRPNDACEHPRDRTKGAKGSKQGFHFHKKVAISQLRLLPV